MNIAENILRHSLQNVHFLTGTACGGKTTAAKALCEKYGLLHFNDNWHEDRFQVYRSLCDEKHQPQSTKKRETTDWEAFFSRSVEQFLADSGDYGEYDEYVEFMIIDLIKLSQNRKVIADIGVPLPLLTQLSTHNRIACLLATPDMVTCAEYGKREDHREFLECILSLEDPAQKIATQDALFQISVAKTYADVHKYGLFHIIRDKESTVERTVCMLEAHFGLQAE